MPAGRERTRRESPATTRTSRREFLRFLLGSPALLASAPALVECLLSADARGGEGDDAAREAIAAAADAVTVFDFEPVAKRNLLAAHYDYLSLGVGDEVTLRANREAFARVQLLPRRLVDVREVDMRREILGTKLSCPIVLAPAGSQRAYHAEGELAVARAAKRKDHLQILSMGSSESLEDVSAARGAPIWSQLFAQRVWPVTHWLLRQAESAGCPAVVLTVDIVGLPSGRERIDRYRRADNPECLSCHGSAAGSFLRAVGRIASAAGVDPAEIMARSMILDWGIVDRIRDATSMKLVIKGILTPEDASHCVDHGVDAIVVSNHGGRAEDNGLATIAVLPAIAAAVGGRIPILIDSGFRRGSDVFKALALGASAVCIGRPYLWGLAAFGQDGVESVLAILRKELEAIMRQMGTPSLSAITSGHVRPLTRDSD